MPQNYEQERIYHQNLSDSRVSDFSNFSIKTKNSRIPLVTYHLQSQNRINVSKNNNNEDFFSS